MNLCVILLMGCVYMFRTVDAQRNFQLLILHNNDMHARFEEYSDSLDGRKIGGFARTLTVIKQARKKAKDGTGPPMLYLNAGDTFTGTVWFSVHKWKIVSDFMNLLEPDAMCLGNHEFDEGTKALGEYLASLKFPVVMSNLNVSLNPNLDIHDIQESIVRTVNGRKIGIVGYLTPAAKNIALIEDTIEIEDEITALLRVTKKLHKDGVNIIIAIGHSGLDKDMEVARQVPFIDIIIGGFSRVFMWNGKQPDLEPPSDRYPVVVEHGGHKSLILHAFHQVKYLGYINVEFDKYGEITSKRYPNTNPIFLDVNIKQDASALKLLDKYRQSIGDFYTEKVGESFVKLGGETCRLGECNMGNLITDSLIDHFVSLSKGRYWSDVGVAFVNSGSILKGLRSTRNGSEITRAEMMTALPYDSPVSVLRLTGYELLLVLEHSVQVSGVQSGGFLQMSGVHVQFDRLKPPGKRVVSAKVRCTNCDMPAYKMLKDNATYRVAFPNFLLKGGDGYDILKSKMEFAEPSGTTVNKMIIAYMNRNGPVISDVGGRIVFHNETLRNAAQRSLGNHELADQAQLASFLKNVKFPVVSSNVDFRDEPLLRRSDVKGSVILERQGVKIGVIGYLTPETKRTTLNTKVIFRDEVEAIREESEILKAQGAKIVIALGHSGFSIDKRIAKEVPLVDLVIGGHSRTFLWNGTPPDREKPEGPYPVLVRQESGKTVPVVQAYGRTKYLGAITLKFDVDANLVGFEGQPIFMNQDVFQDPDAEIMSLTYDPILNAEIVGVSKVYLGGEYCRLGECNIGNLIVDAMVAFKASEYSGIYWTDVAVGLINSGAIRGGINTTLSGGNLTRGDLISAFPFGQVLVTLTLKGSDLLATLELGVRSNGETSRGEFLQVSGLRIIYDMAQPTGHRVRYVNVRCNTCFEPIYEALMLDREYRVVVTAFLTNGGDGHDIIKKHATNFYVENINDFDCLINYMESKKYVNPEVDERIKILNPDAFLRQVNQAQLFRSGSIVILLIVVIFILEIK